MQWRPPPPRATPPPPPPPLEFPAARAHLWDRTAAGATTVIDLQVPGALRACRWSAAHRGSDPEPPPAPCHMPQNLRLHISLAPDAWPLLQRLQRGGAAAAALQAHLLPGSSTSRGLHVQLAAAAAPRSAAVPVAVQPAGPASGGGAAATAAQQLEVAASRAPGPAGLAHLLAAAMVAHADGGDGGLVLAGAAVTPAPILDLRPLLPKRLAATPLAAHLQEQLRSPVPPPEEARHGARVRVAGEPGPPGMPAHLPPAARCAGWPADHGPRPQPGAAGSHRRGRV